MDIHGYQYMFMHFHEMHTFNILQQRSMQDFQQRPTQADRAGGRQAAGPSPPDPASMIDNSEKRYLHVATYIFIILILILHNTGGILGFTA
jgi:hypothetical protein